MPRCFAQSLALMLRRFLPTSTLAVLGLVCAGNAWGQQLGQGQANPAQANQTQVRPSQTPGAQAAAPISGAAVQQQAAIQMPFTLTAEEEARLDEFLLKWESRNQNLKNFACKFHRLEYDRVMGPQQWIEREGKKVLAPRHSTEGFGVIEYETPDKGIFRVDKMSVWKAKPSAPPPAGQMPSPVEEGAYEAPDVAMNEQWVSNGKAIFRFDPPTKTVTEFQLPPEMQGKAISEGPLPFLFGSDAAKLKMRYWLRIVTPPQDTSSIWVEAWPQQQQDAANFSVARMIVSKDLVPTAMQVIDPGGRRETVYTFTEAKENRGGLFHQGISVPRTPLGWTKVVENPPAPNAPIAAGAAPTSTGANTAQPLNQAGRSPQNATPANNSLR